MKSTATSIILIAGAITWVVLFTRFIYQTYVLYPKRKKEYLILGKVVLWCSFINSVTKHPEQMMLHPLRNYDLFGKYPQPTNLVPLLKSKKPLNLEMFYTKFECMKLYGIMKEGMDLGLFREKAGVTREVIENIIKNKVCV